MNKNQLLLQVRSRKLGLLIFDARNAAHRTPQECADALAIPLDAYQAYEKGEQSPSLPELENLAFYLDIPLEHFWGKESLTARRKAENITQKEQLRKLRDRVIGASLQIAREKAGLTFAQTAEATGLSEDLLTAYETGGISIPVPDLELLCKVLNAPVDDLIDQKGPVGKWRIERLETDKFLQLSSDLRDFVTRPVNQPYLELARHLSDLPVDKLRTVAEALLEITF